MTAYVEASFEALGTAANALRFCVWTEHTTAPPLALIVYVHPFAEEMNKARRMAALQSRAFANAGASVMQVDLLGCGDSAGASGDATWAAWVDDVVSACNLAAARFAAKWPGQDIPPIWLWGLRAGCLLAAHAAEHLERPPGFIFWQPALLGKPLLQQFLRLDSVGAVLGKSGPTAREPARAALAAGRPGFVAGYTLNPALASGLESARLTPPLRPGRVVWLDVSAQPGNETFPAVLASQAAWHQAGHVMEAVNVVGPSFWQTTEIEDAPALIEATVTAWTLARSAPLDLPFAQDVAA